jgi:glycosyltransferase involved in cell wall biosynthesis
MPRCSAVLIAFNEQSRIEDAVRSVRPFVDEVLVLDGGSTDRTRDLAITAGAKVLEHPFDGFISQKQRATGLAQHDLVFSLDADERIDEELGLALQAVSNGSDDSGLAAWQVRRRNFLDGRALRASGWYPDARLRLFDRRKARWTGAEPHDSLEASGPVGELPGHLLHDPERSTEQFRRGSLLHAQRRARSLAASARVLYPWTAWLHALGHYLRKVLLAHAWRDGRRGWTIAWVGASGVHRKYSLAAKMRRKGPE